MSATIVMYKPNRKAGILARKEVLVASPCLSVSCTDARVNVGKPMATTLHDLVSTVEAKHNYQNCFNNRAIS